MRIFDVALVGAGPAGYAALTAMRGYSGSLVVITGAATEPVQGATAKFVSVAYERQEPAHLAERTAVVGDAPPMFASAEVGGFANYWGKQLQVYESDDPWGRGPFLKNWKAYAEACRALQSDFEVVGGDRQESLENGYEKCAPRLLTGTKGAPGSGLRAMANAVKQRLNQMSDVEVRTGRVNRIELERETVRLELDDGSRVRARCVFLAAGVFGTASILARSLSHVSEIGFSDHAPYTINCLRLGRVLGSPRSYTKRGNYNAMTIRRKKDGRCDLFASVYTVSQAPVSLLTTRFGFGPRFRGRRVGRMIDFVQPVRIWTPKTQVQLRYLPRHGRIEAIKMPNPDLDEGLQDLLGWFASHKVRGSLGVTDPGQGFHYHRLTIGRRKEPVDQVVKSAFNGRVRAIDASCLPEIGCPPHTLTSMAQAFGRVRHELAASNAVREAI